MLLLLHKSYKAVETFRALPLLSSVINSWVLIHPQEPNLCVDHRTGSKNFLKFKNNLIVYLPKTPKFQQTIAEKQQLAKLVFDVDSSTQVPFW